MYIPLKFVSEKVARDIAIAIATEVGGLPTENRVLILSPKDQDVRSGSIIIPGTASEDIPNKGVVIMTGDITEEYRTYVPLVIPGKILTYGRYAGKEIDFNPSIFDKYTSVDFSKYKFTVLSINEIIFSENNPI